MSTISFFFGVILVFFFFDAVNQFLFYTRHVCKYLMCSAYPYEKLYILSFYTAHFIGTLHLCIMYHLSSIFPFIFLIRSYYLIDNDRVF